MCGGGLGFELLSRGEGGGEAAGGRVLEPLEIFVLKLALMRKAEGRSLSCPRKAGGRARQRKERLREIYRGRKGGRNTAISGDFLLRAEAASKVVEGRRRRKKRRRERRPFK